MVCVCMCMCVCACLCAYIPAENIVGWPDIPQRFNRADDKAGSDCRDRKETAAPTAALRRQATHLVCSWILRLFHSPPLCPFSQTCNKPFPHIDRYLVVNYLPCSLLSVHRPLPNFPRVFCLLCTDTGSVPCCLYSSLSLLFCSVFKSRISAPPLPTQSTPLAVTKHTMWPGVEEVVARDSHLQAMFFAKTVKNVCQRAAAGFVCLQQRRGI